MNYRNQRNWRSSRAGTAELAQIAPACEERKGERRARGDAESTKNGQKEEEASTAEVAKMVEAETTKAAEEKTRNYPGKCRPCRRPRGDGEKDGPEGCVGQHTVLVGSA